MKYIITLIFGIALVIGCKKNPTDTIEPETCDINATYTLNATKATVTNGVWGTVSNMSGNCMPIIDPATTTCKHCPVKRTVKIYEYTLRNQATVFGNTGQFFTALNTNLIATVITDNDGFYQTNLPNGRYSVVIIEDGNLYANGGDVFGGINPITINNAALKSNFTMTYKAVF